MNKKRLLKFIAVSSIFTVSAVSAIVVAGCKNKHTHDLTEVEAVAATCTEDGNRAYWVCSGCDLIFEDGEGKTETTAEDVAESKLGHDLSKHVEAEAATCTKPGNIEYWECSRGDGKFKDAQGTQAVTDVVTTKSHTWGTNGHHEMVYPTTETEGTKEYWECGECGNVYLDSYGDTVTTKDKLSIDKVLDNIDGVVGSAYTQSTAYVIGRDVANGGVGIIANAFLGKDGVYLHIRLNHNSSPDEQSQGHGKVGVYMNIRNENNLYLPGDAGTSFREGVGIELYINGKVEQQQPFSLKHFENKINAEGAATAYTTVWELFMPNAELAKANSGKLSGAFEEKDGKTLLKQGYNVLMTVCGNLTLNEKDRFDDGDGSVCKYNHNNSEWTFIYREGYGDWGTDQKYMVVGKDGFSKTHVRGTDVYNVNAQKFANATLSAQLPATVDWNGKLQGSLTVDRGYILTGIKINGKAAYTGGAQEGGSLVYDFEIDIKGLGLAWNETDLDVEFVVIEASYVNATFTLKGNSGGKLTAVAEGTQITLVDDFGNEISAEVGANGSVMVNNLLCQHYVIKIKDYLDGEMNVISADVDDVVIEYEFASPIGDVSHLVDLSHMNDESATITMGANGLNGLGQGEYAQGVGVEINIPEDMKEGAYVLETTVSVNDPKAQGAWLQRFAITFAQGDSDKYKNKFVIWWNDLLTNEFPSAIWADDGTPCGGAVDRNQSFDWLAEAVMDGLQLKIIRNGENVAVYAYNFDAEKWVTLLEGKTSATAANRIAFHVSGASWTFSDISFEKYEAPSADVIEEDVIEGAGVTFNKTSIGAGESVTLTLSGGSSYLLSVNGKEISVNGNTYEIAYDDYASVMLNPQITVSVHAFTNTEVSGTSNMRVDGQTYNLDSAAMGEKEVLGYARYETAGNTIVSGGVADGYALNDIIRYGDQGGASKFIVNGKTSDKCLYLDPNVYKSVTLNVKKGVTEILVYTGAYEFNASGKGDRMTFKLLEQNIVIGDASFDIAQTRAYEVKFLIDTTAWEDGETREIELYFGAETDCQLAAIVLLGGEYVKNYEVETVTGENVSYSGVATTITNKGTLTGTVTGKNGYKVYGVNICETIISVDESGSFSVDIAELGLAASVDVITVEALIDNFTVTKAEQSMLAQGNINLDAAALDGKTILAYQRYEGNNVAPYGYNCTDWDYSGYDADAGRNASDYDGDRVTFTANGKTNSNTRFIDEHVTAENARQIKFKVSKGATEILVYTGSWNQGTLYFDLLNSDGVKVGSYSYAKGTDRGQLVKFIVDTSKFKAGESREFTLKFYTNGGNMNLMLAGIVVLGEDFSKTYDINVSENDKAIVALDNGITSISQDGTLSGTVTAANNGKAYYVMVAGKKIVLGDNGKFSISVKSLNLARGTDAIDISVVASDTVFNTKDENLSDNAVIALDGEDIVWWRRYGMDGRREEKEGGVSYVDNGFASKRGGNDSGLTFNNGANKILAGEFACTPHGISGNETSYTVNLTIKKGMSKVVFYTGTWNDNNVVTFKFMESDGTELIVNEIKKGSSVRHTLTLNVDTTSWNEGETREFKVFIGGGVDAAILEAITVHGNIA